MTDRKKTIKVQGHVFAIVTPFDANGDVDFNALKSYLRFLEHNGVKNIVVNGTTGEFSSLTLQERCEIVRFCRVHFSGIIINNISSACLRDSLYLLGESEGYSDFTLVLPPFYYANPNKEGIMTFFKEILSYSLVPVFLYNFPRHTQFHIATEMVELLLRDHGKLVGIKDSSSDIEVALSYKKVSPNFQVFVGKDSAALDVLKEGLDGSVTGGGNPVPELLVAVYDNFIGGDLESTAGAMKNLAIWNSFKKDACMDEIPLVKLILSQRIESFPTQVRSPFTEAEPGVADIVLKQYHRLVTPLLKK